MRRHLKTSPIDALSDLKIYSEKLKSLERDLTEWQKTRRETFVNEKQMLQSNLQKLGDNQPNLKTNFDTYISSDANKENLHIEAGEHFVQILETIFENLLVSYNELRYGKEIQQIDINLNESEIENEIDVVKNHITSFPLNTLDNQADLDRFVEEIYKTQEKALHFNKLLVQAVSQQPPESNQEEELLSVIVAATEDYSHGVELKRVLINMISSNQELDVDDIGTHLFQLFKKNQINIKIQPRRR